MLVTAALVFASATAVSPSATADTVPTASVPATVSADPLPTVQQNGVVYSQVTVGNIVYATGRFTETWPAGQTDQPGVNETARSNLLAYDITTGDLVTSFDHSLNQEGLGITASPDGSTVYVVGDFTTVDGAAHKHIAAFDTATGALITGFKAGLSGETAAVTASSSAVYVGGNFFGAGGTTRTRLAAFSPSGALLSWAPTADDGQVSALTLAPDGSRVVVGGRFTTLDGQAANGMGSVDSVTGTTVEPWAINTQIRDGGGASSTKCGITDLSTDGTNVYGGGFAYGCGNFEGTFAADPDTGTVVWINDCHGDTYSTQPIGGVLYVASHSHDCSAIGSFPNGTPDGYNQRATAYTTAASGGTDTGPDSYGWNYSGQPDGTLLHWFPTLAPGKVTGQNQAAWSVTGNANYVSYGGEFPNVDGVAQQGLVRFAVSSLAPNQVGPIADTENSTLVPSVSSSSYGRVDLAWTATWDRDNANLTYTVLRDGTAVGSVTQASSFWQLPTVTYTDKGLTPGTVHTYRIRASDPFGNTVGSGASSSVTVMGGTPPPDDAPTAAFTSGCTQLSCTFDGTGSTDPDGSITSYAWDFADGTTATGATPSHTFTTGGTHFVTLTVTADSGATDIATHAVDTNAPPVAAFTSACTRLKCTFDASTSTDSDGKVESYFWDLGDETTSTKKKLTHTYAIGGTHMVSLTVSDNSGATDTVTRAVTTNAPPLARFTASCSTSTCSFDASASSDPGGSIASYAWTFGDGARGSGVRPSHTYGTSGSHTVTLTVTDDGGAATAVSHAVTTSAPVWASDAFSRTMKSGWGSAHAGGAWSDRGCASLSVTGGYGRLVGRRGATCSAWLPAVARTSTDTTATLSVPSVPRAGMQISVLGRRISASSDIRLQLSLARGGAVKAALLGVVGSKHTALSPTKTLPLPSSAHGRLHVELVVTGTSPTVVRAKVWADGKAEPSGWTVKGQSSRAVLQHSGSVGVATLLHGGTGAPATAQLRVLSLRSTKVIE